MVGRIVVLSSGLCERSPGKCPSFCLWRMLRKAAFVQEGMLPKKRRRMVVNARHREYRAKGLYMFSTE